MKKFSNQEFEELQERNEILEKENKKYKRINTVFIAIILIGVIGLIALVEVYFHKDIIENLKIMNKVKEYRSTINKNFNYDYEYIENNHNAAYKLKLISAYGDNQGYHPKVLNFKEKWNGYKYWMIFSPFPYGDEKYENPNLLASNDMINWEEPKGFKNPVEDIPKDFKADLNYNSDPHIVYIEETDTMELYWRYVNDENDKVILYRKTTKDGVHWSDKEEILTATRSKKDYISPAIIHEDGKYKMWFVDRNRVLKYIESKDGYKYSDERVIELNYPLPKMTTWHLDVIKTEKGYEMIVVAYKNWKDRNGMNLYYFQSKDNVNYSEGIIILRPSTLSWDNRGIYRSSFIYEDGKYYVFYSALNMMMERGIGLSYGEHIENLVGSNIKESN